LQLEGRNIGVATELLNSCMQPAINNQLGLTSTINGQAVALNQLFLDASTHLAWPVELKNLILHFGYANWPFNFDFVAKPLRIWKCPNFVKI
jgi:hypothetical protein